MKIVHVIPALTRGGAERVVVDLANAAADRGDSVSVVSAVGQAGDLGDELRAGIDLRRINPGGSVRSSYLHTVPWMMRNRAWLLSQDVIHCHLTFGAVVGMMIAAMRGKRASPALVETYHAVGMPIGARDRALHARLLAGRDAVALMAVDTYWERQMAQARVPVMVIPNGVHRPATPTPAALADYREQLGLPEGAVIVGTVSRLAAARRPADVLEIFARIQKRAGDRAAFLIAGEGPERESLERDVDRLGLRDRVRLPGLARQPALAFAAIDCYLTLNVGPISGVAGLEAAASGIPVVGYQLRKDYDGQDDWIWSSNDLDEVAEQISALTRDPDRRRTVAEAQSRIVHDSLTVEAMAEAYRKLYYTAFQHRKSINAR